MVKESLLTRNAVYSPGVQTPKTKAIQEMQRQLAASHAQLKEIASRHMVSPPLVQPDNTGKVQNTEKVLNGTSFG